MGKTHVFALAGHLRRERHLPDYPLSQRVPLPLLGEQPQLLLLVLAQVVAVPGISNWDFDHLICNFGRENKLEQEANFDVVQV